MSAEATSADQAHKLKTQMPEFPDANSEGDSLYLNPGVDVKELSLPEVGNMETS
jgi:hypothetical protein